MPLCDQLGYMQQKHVQIYVQNSCKTCVCIELSNVIKLRQDPYHSFKTVIRVLSQFLDVVKCLITHSFDPKNCHFFCMSLYLFFARVFAPCNWSLRIFTRLFAYLALDSAVHSSWVSQPFQAWLPQINF